MQITEITILIWIVCGLGAFLIAQNRGASNAPSWFLVGIIFGPLGIVLAVVGARPAKQTRRQDALETLRRLAQLRADGQLTTDEYEAKKQELLIHL